MKLNGDFIIYNMGGEQTLVPTGDAAEKYHGIVRCNETAAFVIGCLEVETTEEEIIVKVEEQYEGDHDRIAANVKKTLETLRSIGALEE